MGINACKGSIYLSENRETKIQPPKNIERNFFLNNLSHVLRLSDLTKQIS